MLTYPGKAGEKVAQDLIAMVHLMYQNLTTIRFLKGLVFTLNQELNRREYEYNKAQEKKKKQKGKK